MRQTDAQGTVNEELITMRKDNVMINRIVGENTTKLTSKSEDIIVL